MSCCLVAVEQEVPESCSSATEEVSVEWDLLRADLQAMFGEALEVRQSPPRTTPCFLSSPAMGLMGGRSCWSCCLLLVVVVVMEQVAQSDPEANLEEKGGLGHAAKLCLTTANAEIDKVRSQRPARQEGGRLVAW